MPHEDCLFIRLEDFFAARRGEDPDDHRGEHRRREPRPGARDAAPERRPAVMPPGALRGGGAPPARP